MRSACALGIGASALFVALRAFDGFGEPRHWHDMVGKGWPALLAFLNTSKYPASFLFLLMTLGPLIALLPLVENAKGWLAGALETFGRVPLFYYLLHIPTIHIAAICVSLIRTGSVTPWLFANHPLNPGTVTGGIHVEPATALPRMGDRHRDPVLPVPVVRGVQGAPQESVAFVPVTAN